MDKLSLVAILQAENKCGLALDIDETLSATNVYWFTKLQELFGNPESLTPKEMAMKYHYTQNVPYWQTPQALAWMKEQCNSDELQKNLSVIDGAVEYVSRVNEIIPIVAYITARPTIVVPGTEYWLKVNNFPKAPVIAKPLDITEHFTSWKAEVLQSLYPSVLGIVDDHPGMVDQLPTDYHGTIFLITHQDHPRTDITVVCGMDWPKMYEQIQKHNPLQQ